MQLTSLLRTAAAAALLSVLLLTTFQKAQAQTEAVLYNFCSVGGCLDGELPNGTLTLDGYGGFYGTTEFGGTSGDGPNCYFDAVGCGTAFQLVPEPAGGCPSGSTAGNGWCEYIVYNFCQVSTGARRPAPTEALPAL